MHKILTSLYKKFIKYYILHNTDVSSIIISTRQRQTQQTLPELNQAGHKGGREAMMTDKQFDSYKRQLLQQLQNIYKEQQNSRESADEKFKQFITTLESELTMP